MALSTNTTLIPGYTIVTDSVTGGIAVIRTTDDSTSYEYTIANEIADKLDIIAARLEDISVNLNSSSQQLEQLTNLASGTGIKTVDPLAWLGLMSVYKLYAEDPGSMGLEALKAYKAKIDAMVESLG